jgi:hypothetical protein
MALKLTDLRSWLVVLRDAALMRPHPAAIAATPDDKEIDGYLARLAALLLAGEWVMRRLDRNLLQGLVAFAEPLRRMPELKAHHPGFAVLDGMVAARRVVAESTFLVPPYVINGAVEVATLVGVAILISWSVRPVPPPARAATGAALSALVSGSLFGVVVGWLLLRAAEVSGFLAKARAVQAAASDAELLAALQGAMDLLWIVGLFSLLGLLPIIAEAVVLARALRAFGARRGLAWPGAAAAAVLSNASIPLMDAFGIRRLLYLFAAD